MEMKDRETRNEEQGADAGGRKSLDEVIIAQELCELGDRCTDCPYAKRDENGDWSFCCGDAEADTLHYLKIYRSDMRMYADNQKYWEDELKQKIKDFGDAKDRYIKRLKELEIGTLNDPLTWEELLEMEGKPVWVEEKDMPSTWIIIWDVTENWLYPTGCDAYRHEEFGKTWQAYRKERKINEG